MKNKAKANQDPKEFLTEKVRPTISPLGWFGWFWWALFTASTVMAIASLLEQGNTLSAGMGAVLLAILLRVLYSKGMRLVRSRQAMKAAHTLGFLHAREIAREDYERIAGSPQAVELLKKLIAQGYLTDVSYDELTGRIVCEKRTMDRAVRHLAFVCESCGASGVLERWAKPECPYCGGAVKVKK